MTYFHALNLAGTGLMKIKQRIKMSATIWGICLAAFVFPMDFTITDGITLFRLIASLTIISWLAYILVAQKEKIYVNRVTWFAILFTVFGLMSAFWATSQDRLLKTIILLLLFISFYLTTLNSVSTRLIFNRVGLSYLFGSVVVGVIAIFRVVFGSIPLELRVSAFSHQNLNIFGAVLAVGLLFIIYFSWNVKRYSQRLLLLGVSIILIISLLLSGSRMAWLSLIASIIISLTFSKGISRKKVIANVFIIVFLIAGIFYLVDYLNLWPKELTKYLVMRTSINFAIQTGGARRLGIWRIGWKMFKNNPLIGVGLRNFSVAIYDRYSTSLALVNYTPVGGSHSMYLSVLTELGILGALPWFLVLIFSFRYALQCRDPAGRFLAFSIMIFLAVAGLFATPQIFGWFWLALSLSHACSRAHNLERPRQSYSKLGQDREN